MERETTRRAKNLMDSLLRPEPQADERYSMTRGLAALYAVHLPGFPLHDVPKWEDSLERAEHAKLKQRAHALGQEVAEGDLLVPNWAWQRDMSATSGPKGGYAIGTDMPFHDSLLRAQSVAFQAGVQLVEAGSNSLAWPKQITPSTPAWLSPGVAAASSAGTFAQISSTPKTILSFIEVPIQLLTQGGPAGEAFIKDGLQKDLATAVDLAVLAGTGASGQPLGIINTPNVGSVVGTSIDYAKCVEFQTDVADNNAVLNPNGLHYVSTPTVASLLKSRQRFTSTDSPLWKGAIHRGEIEGVPALSTKQMPAGMMIYGDFSSAYLVEWGALALRVNPYQDFNRGYIGIRAMWMIDVVVRYPLSFSVATSIT